MTQTLEELQEQVVEGAKEKVLSLTRQALNDSITTDSILNQALIPAMHTVGELYEDEEFFLPEMMASALATQASMKLLRPLLVEGGTKSVAKAILGTVKGDLHDIGKNLVGMMWEGAGFEVIDLGPDVPGEKFIETMTNNPDAILVGLSALISTTMPMMQTIITEISEAGIRDKVKIIVGGAGVTQEYADQIGADGYAPDASSAVRVSKRILGISD